MRSLNGRRRRAAYSVTGNVVWLSFPARDLDFRRVDPIALLKRNLAQLVGEIERSERLNTDLAAAIDARCYQLYRHSARRKVSTTDRCLAATQRNHVGTMLQFLHAVAATGRDQGPGAREPAAQCDRLAYSIRELEASLQRARRLSQAVLTQCQRRDRREDISPAGQPRH